MTERLTRIAIVSSDRCKPKKCRHECKKSCPVVKTGTLSLSQIFIIGFFFFNRYLIDPDRFFEKLI
jgi:hypothetical protein